MKPHLEACKAVNCFHLSVVNAPFQGGGGFHCVWERMRLPPKVIVLDRDDVKLPKECPYLLEQMAMEYAKEQENA